ncbi:hypothetical protein CLOSTMETH_02503 [[Clostridium] methylpentosum DSM 5476]|uniref:Uncharacterized protein n=1 Tax=[Clostridium] methylpentosum DSM 5476 TaxID=537013 RepID=C0EF62_9FIRM|nr:hypothetical protein CLOSTMETH_02503 [[Clostridium] methylpentosum DSM 5476]
MNFGTNVLAFQNSHLLFLFARSVLLQGGFFFVFMLIIYFDSLESL